MRHARKLVPALLALTLAVALTACGDDDGNTVSEGVERSQDAGGKAGSGSPNGGQAGSGSLPTIVIADGEPVGGVAELEFSAGDRIRFQVESDVEDEIHVHGYDLSEDVTAGGATSFDFPADIEGIFEVELEERAEPIAELRVNP